MQNIIPLEYGKYYHIYNRGINGANLFTETTNFEYFLSIYSEHIEPIAETFAYCLMSNHFHFLVKIKNEEHIDIDNIKLPSQSFSNLFNAYTKAFNKRNGRHGALFERPFRRKAIEDAAYLKNVICYIHNNPVNHGFSKLPIQYRWSSYSTCISDKPTKLKRDEILEIFGDTENFKYVHENYTIPDKDML